MVVNDILRTLAVKDHIEREAEKQELKLAAKELMLSKGEYDANIDELMTELLNIRNGIDELYLRLKRLKPKVNNALKKQ